jgi:predicted DNA-binding protein (MmcQ/YjbR family)
MVEKEARLEKEYRVKAEDMKINMVEIKKKFEVRCEEFKKQLLEFKNNNEAIEALRKQHKVEIAAHV